MERMRRLKGKTSEEGVLEEAGEMLRSWENPQPQYENVVKETLVLEEGHVQSWPAVPGNIEIQATKASTGSQVNGGRRNEAVEAHEGTREDF